MNTKTYYFSSTNITNQLLAYHINLFWKDIMNNYQSSAGELKFISLFITVEYIGSIFKSLNSAAKVQYKDKDKFIDIIIKSLAFKDNQYFTTEAVAIHFYYKQIPLDKLVDDKTIIHELEDKHNQPSTKIEYTRIFGHDLPNTMDLFRWGTVISHNDAFIVIKFTKKGFDYYYKVFSDYNNNFYSNIIEIYSNLPAFHEKKGDINEDNCLLRFKDERKANDSPSNFIREVNKIQYIIKNGVVIIKSESHIMNYIKALKSNRFKFNKFLCLDIETRTINGQMTPYCICYFDGEIKYSFYLSDYNDVEEMMKESLKTLFVKNDDGTFKYNDYLIYAHNFSKFDGVFILKHLINLTKTGLDLSIFDSALSNEEVEKVKKGETIEPTRLEFNIIKRDNDFINIELIAERRLFSVNFRDSLLLLPSSLNKLAKAFNSESEQKGIFPYSFVNIAELEYVGPLPDFKYFSPEVKIEEYNNYSLAYHSDTRKMWSLREETIKYCMQDCISLYQIITNFSNMIWEDFHINLKYVPTISSLALRAYKTKFLPLNQKDPNDCLLLESKINMAKDEAMPKSEKEEKKIENKAYPRFDIPILIGKVFDFINMSYTGGHVDVYVPHGYNVHCYDINSLYPTVMKETPMAVNKPKFFTCETDDGESEIWNTRPYGFFEVDITAPLLSHPIIQTRISTPSGYRTVASVGQWKDVLSSIEIYNAVDNFGYKFKINRGYIFDSDIVYNKYIDHFNIIKMQSDKGSPMYLISKLLMNGLYGKTGQNYRFKDHIIGSEDLYQALLQNKNLVISDVKRIDENLLLLSIYDKCKYNIISDPSLDVNTLSVAFPEIKRYSGCVAHASAIAAGARVKMAQYIKYLNDHGYIIYYMDTDSLFIDRPLPDYMVSKTDLGKFKLEYVLKEAVFLAPKVYGGVMADGTEIIKIKGLSQKTISKDVQFDMLKSLLYKDASHIFNQTKWMKNFSSTTINLLDQTYELMATENKRKLVYDNNNYFIKTEPFVIDNNKRV